MSCISGCRWRRSALLSLKQGRREERMDTGSELYSTTCCFRRVGEWEGEGWGRQQRREKSQIHQYGIYSLIIWQINITVGRWRFKKQVYSLHPYSEAVSVSVVMVPKIWCTQDRLKKLWGPQGPPGNVSVNGCLSICGPCDRLVKCSGWTQPSLNGCCEWLQLPASLKGFRSRKWMNEIVTSSLPVLWHPWSEETLNQQAVYCGGGGGGGGGGQGVSNSLPLKLSHHALCVKLL